MTTERLCKQCLRWLPEEAFQKGALNANGKPYVRHTCKACVNFRRACQRSSSPRPVKGQRRTCKRCGVEQPLEAFFMGSAGHRQWTCKACHTARKLERIHAMKANDPAAYATHKRKCADRENRRKARLALQRLGLGG